MLLLVTSRPRTMSARRWRTHLEGGPPSKGPCGAAFRSCSGARVSDIGSIAPAASPCTLWSSIGAMRWNMASDVTRSGPAIRALPFIFRIASPARTSSQPWTTSSGPRGFWQLGESTNHGWFSPASRILNTTDAFFSRPDGSFGWEEVRRDPEDRGAWTPVQYYSGATVPRRKLHLRLQGDRLGVGPEAIQLSPSAQRLLL